MLLTAPSGNLFGLSQNAGMGWEPQKLLGEEVLILSTHGGLRAPDGTPIALGFHTGHWELGALVAEAARDHPQGPQRRALRRRLHRPLRRPHPGHHRHAGLAALPQRCRHRAAPPHALPAHTQRRDRHRHLRQGPARHDDGAGLGRQLPHHPYPRGRHPACRKTGEDAGKVQTIGARYAQNQITLEAAAEMGCRACATPGGGCQFLGTAATAQVIGEALGLSLPHTALAPSGAPIWLDAARRSASALLRLHQLHIGTRDVLTQASLDNAMVAHAAFGGSTNLLLHLPAIAYSAGLKRPVAEDWAHSNRLVPRLVDALPNGPRNFATIQVFLAGGLPEVMLHLRRAGLLNTKALTVTGETLGQNLDWWEDSPRRHALRKKPERPRRHRPRRRDHGPRPRPLPRLDRHRLLPPTATSRPRAPSVKSTRHRPFPDWVKTASFTTSGPPASFVTEEAAIHAIKQGEIHEQDVMVLVCGGPAGAGMQEIYQITSALKWLPVGKHVALLTDARFSGVSTGACIGHISPEALARRPHRQAARRRPGWRIRIDRQKLTGTVNLIGDGKETFGAEEGARRLAARPPRSDLQPHPELPDDTRLWAALVQASGGVWGGCVYDVDAIVSRLQGTVSERTH